MYTDTVFEIKRENGYPYNIGGRRLCLAIKLMYTV